LAARCAPDHNHHLNQPPLCQHAVDDTCTAGSNCIFAATVVRVPAAALVLPCQAFTAAMGALQHGPTNARAWLRAADGCKAAGRWQLAHLFYSAAVDELGLDDDAVRVSMILLVVCLPLVKHKDRSLWLDTTLSACCFLGGSAEYLCY
jgi:hypothetical protein